jgi:uncharacterized protein (TIGR02453 family)
MNQGITKEFYDFFKSLAANNHKDWFDANRKEYEQHVKIPFEHLVHDIIEALRKVDPQYDHLQAKDCIFRINRDIRFSNDKTPYKLNRSAIINPGGRKSRGPAGFYFEIGPGECAFYAGAYMPEKQELYGIRKSILNDPEKFFEIIGSAAFKKRFGEVQGSKQKRLDKEFKDISEKEPLIFNTQFYIMHKFEPELTQKKEFVKYLLDLNNAAKDFADFINRGFQQTETAKA